MFGISRWGCLLGVAIALGNTFNAHCVAQITPDVTLPNNSIVTPSGNTINITGGTQAGNNLFHSFQEFSIPTGSGAFFNNAVSIQNIISRVTGGSISNIDGFIRANGVANVFLLNPNGIIFGPNASLNVGGSFVATTANAIQFGNIGFFSADNPNAPTPLLTINPSALLFNQLPTAITNRSIAAAGVNPAGVEVTGLRVPDGKSLLLGGGNINVDGGVLRAYGGRIELAGLAAPGAVGLNVAENTLSFGIPNEIPRADISLTNAGEINVRGADGGSIAINAQNLSLAGESKVRAGIDTGLGTLQSKAGDIDINAKGATTLTDASFIANVPQERSVGKGGNVNITTGSLGLINGSSLNISNFGQGDGGNINLNVRDALTLAGVDQNGLVSAILSSVRSQTGNKGGSIDIQAGSVSLADGAYLSTSTFGKGDAGNVSIQASDAVSLSFADIYSNVGTGGVGNGGNINITASSLSLKDGAQLQTSLREADTQNNLLGGRGNAGNVNIDVRGAVTLAGSSGIFSTVGTAAEGNGGNITIKSGSLSLSNQAFLSGSTFGKGNAGNVFIQASDAVSLEGGSIFSNVGAGGVGNSGNINITASSLSLKDGAQLQTSLLQTDTQNNLPGGRGNAGNVKIDVRGAVTLGRSSAIFSSVDTGAEGNGGNIEVKTGSLSLTEGSEFNTKTLGQGNAGNITINAREAIALDGAGSNGIFSRIISAVNPEGAGKAGGIQITTGSLRLTNGAFIASDTLGKGDAGNITIDASDRISFDGDSFAASGVGRQAVGKGGDIRVTTGSLSLTNGARLTNNVSGQGEAGNITIDARDTVNLDGIVGDAISGIQSDLLSGVGKGGDIRVTTGSLSVTNGAALSTSTSGRGNAGNITINARDTVTFDGVGNDTLLGSSANSTVVSNGVGNGGNIRVNARALFLKNGGQLNANSFGQGNAGSITIDTRDTVAFDGVASNGNYSAAQTLGSQGNGGDILVTTGTLSLTNGGLLFTSARGNSGNITINARDAVNFDGVGSNGSSSGAVSLSLPGGVAGKGGDIQVTTGSLSVTNGAQLNAATSGRGDAGNIFVQASDLISLSNSSYITSSVLPGGVGNSGNIDINTRTLTLTDGSQIAAAVAREFGNLPGGRGRGGEIRINASDSVTLSGISSTGFSSGLVALTERGASGDAGSINVTTDNFRVADGALVVAATSNEGNAGDITINANNFEAVNGGQVLTSTRSSGNAGTIRLNIRDSITLAGSDPNFTARLALIEQQQKSSGSTDRVSDFILLEGEGTSGLFASTAAGSTGQGGSIFINPPRRVTITDGAKISVNSDGTGNAGNITLRAGNLTLDNKASISAQTASSQGGNINLNLGEVLLLRRGSQISATAGTSGAGGDGGNITIDAPRGFIVALPDENSDITANAFSGQGGNVTIRAAGIFNIAPLSRQELERLSPNDLDPNNLPTNDITAISQQNPTLGGQVTLNTPDVDPSKGLVELPTVVADTSELIANTSCSAVASKDSDTEKNTFTITGRGGLPPSPYEPLTSDVVWLDTRLSSIASQQQRSEKPATKPPSKAGAIEIVPATGWVFDGKGHVTLISQTSGNTSLGSTRAACPKQ